MEENTMAIVLKVLGVIEAICGVFAGIGKTDFRKH